LEHWPEIVTVVQDWLDRLAAFLYRLPIELALAVLLLPIVLAILSRNIALSLGCIIAVLAATLVFLAPAHTAVVLGIALYLGSVVASLLAIIVGSKFSKFDEIAVLQRQVNDLMAAEQERLMRGTRSRSKGQSADRA
jgi:hypothetical protein